MDSVVLEGDRQLSYARLGNTGGPVLVILHGMGDDHEEMLPMGEAFADRFDVVIPDLPGHGSSYRDAARCSINVSADDVAALCRALSIDQAFVVGHSRGGRVAIAFAGRHPELVSRLVVLDTAIARPTKTTENLTSFYDSITDSNFESQLRDVMMPMLFKPDDSPALIESTSRHMLDAGPEVFRAMGYDVVGFDTAAAVKAVQAPTLMVVATAAPFNAPDQVRDIVPNWDVVAFNLSHHMLVESPEVNDAIGGFLA
jgi:pimeloyl-ACP methyl ester carboxylesterase